MNEWEEPIPSRGPGSLCGRGEGLPTTCLRCNWTGAPVAPDDHRCPRCEIAPETDAEWEAGQQRAALPRVGRNDPCPCGSGKKWKKCHGK